jgi:hypothetical protein
LELELQTLDQVPGGDPADEVPLGAIGTIASTRPTATIGRNSGAHRFAGFLGEIQHDCAKVN